ncbi:MAG: group II intron reverse transcriptase domain-containing protein [Candidatus Doudnabacteria bacterium]|nr:group II intron reverse transcriptase domain-containing protein [Candidatus Doudnabacteria bacterium]
MAHGFDEIISVENLLLAWQEFIRGKRNKPDVQLFAHALIDNILQLHNDLANKTYRHGGYYQFKISDPKPRDISKASVRDRLLHHAIYRILYPFFDRTFIADSFSCRVDKGTHKAVNRLLAMFRKASKNNTRTCWVLKCDIRKFFASIDHDVLKNILARHVPDIDMLWLLGNIIDSFGSDCFVGRQTKPRPENRPPRNDIKSVFASEAKQSHNQGLPLGNLTSQLFVNIYMNEFDQFVKHKLKVKHYIRYADDFIILSPSEEELTAILSRIAVLLKQELKLRLHPHKVTLKTFASGIDFLGWVNFPHHRVLRTATKKRMLKRIRVNSTNETLQSYLGLLKHGNTFQKIFASPQQWPRGS